MALGELLDQLPIAVVQLDDRSRVVHANPRAADLLQQSIFSLLDQEFAGVLAQLAERGVALPAVIGDAVLDDPPGRLLTMVQPAKAAAPVTTDPSVQGLAHEQQLISHLEQACDALASNRLAAPVRRRLLKALTAARRWRESRSGNSAQDWLAMGDVAPLAIEAVQLAGLWQKVALELAPALRLGGQQVTCVSTTPVEVVCDPTGLRLALVELLENAILHGPLDGAVQLAAVELPDGRVKYSVTDAGPEWLPERLVAVTCPTPERGLGLWLVQRIASRYGGEMTHERSFLGGNQVALVIPRGSQRRE
jgi:signal transduction histidine kinase